MKQTKRPSALPVILVAVAVALFGAWSAPAVAAPAATAPLTATPQAADAPAEQLQVVLDTSESVPMTYKLQALAAIAHEVRAWPRPLPAAGGAKPERGLDIQLRGVSGDSYAPENVIGTWTIPSVPAVEGLPTTVTTNFTQRVIDYKTSRATATRAHASAVRSAARAATALLRLRPKTTYVSEIEGAVSAAAQSFSPGGSHKLLMISDLAQNRQPQIAGRLDGAEVLIAHLCWKATTCASQETTWGKRLQARGAASVKFVRIERLPTALATFLSEA